MNSGPKGLGLTERALLVDKNGPGEGGHQSPANGDGEKRLARKVMGPNFVPGALLD